MKIVFRADGGGEGLGIGHLSRCIAIGESFSEKEIASEFIVRNFPAGIEFVKRHGYPVKVLETKDDLESTLKEASKADIVIVDSHLHTSDFFTQLYSDDYFVAVIDDELKRRIEADAIIGNAYASEKDYAEKFIRKDTLFLGGPDFLPLRKEFQNLPKHKISNSIQRILITMGGEDPENASEVILKALLQYKSSLHIDLLIGPAYKYLESLRTLISSNKHNIQLHQNIANPLSLYKNIDVAITASGVTFWELASVGVPMIVVKIAENQEKSIQFAKKNELAIVLGEITNLTAEDFLQALLQLEDPNIRRRFSAVLQKAVDGRGAERIVNALIEHCKKKKALQIELKPFCFSADSEESHMMWEWRNDPTTRKMSKNTDLIEWESHKKWLQELLQNQTKILLLAYHKGKPFGVVRFDKEGKSNAEININIAPDMRGKGLGSSLIIAATKYAKILGVKHLLAVVRKENLPSIKAFLSAGYIVESQDKEFVKLSFR